MDFQLTEEQQLVRAGVREFCEKYVEPIAGEVDQEPRFPSENVRRLAEQDWLGIPFPDEYGGAGADYLTFIIAIEELSRACSSTGSVVLVNTSLASFPLHRFGNEEQRRDYLVPLCRGEMLGAFAVSETGAGHEGAVETVTAVRDGNEYVLNGTKVFVSNAPVAGVFIVFASTDKSMGTEGLCAFIVPAGTPGMMMGKPVKKMGMRGALASEVLLQDCRIPRENLLGQEGEGGTIAGTTLDGYRIGLAAQALGIAETALDESVRYSKERVQFDKPICTFQAIQWMLANMATEIEVSRFLVYYAAWCFDQGLPYGKEAAMAKLMASGTAVRHTDSAVQIHGGIGTIKGQKVERLYRDAKITQICEGSPEVMKMAIAKSLLCQ
jgi:butyryl-CoA dehydrogenase